MDSSIESPRLEDFAELDWQAVPSNSSSSECWTYSGRYRELAAEREASGDLRGRDAYILLWKCTSMMLVPGNATDPFDAVIRFPSGRSPILEDISENEVKILWELAPKVIDPELRARMADICWTSQRVYPAALLAIDSYVDAAAVLDAENRWLDARDRLERALRLAAMLGRGNAGRLNTVVGAIEANLASHDKSVPDRFLQPARLMTLLIEFNLGDSGQWAILSNELAAISEHERNWEIAQDYWERKAEWERLRKDSAAQHAAKLRAAELYIEIANDFLAKSEPDHLSASIHLSRALEAMRQIGESERAVQIHRELLVHQEQSTSQFKSFSESMDISKFVQQAMDAVKDKSFPDAVLALATLYEPPKVGYLQETAKKNSQEFVLRSLLSTQRVDVLGRVVATKPTGSIGDQEANDAALRADMFEHAGQLHRVVADATIEPARYQIELQHRTQYEDFLSLVTHNPLVSIGREVIIARGLHAGLTGDFLVACHLLIPQMEHSIRHVLNRRGVITSTLDSEGIQEEIDLGRLLRLEELSRAFGEDLVFDLQGLLVDRFGSNLRNLLAHGLLGLGYFYSSQAIYFWWLTLRYFCLPILVADQQSSTETPNNGDGKTVEI